MKPSAKIRREKDMLYRTVQALVVESNLTELIASLNDTINTATSYASLSDEDSENYMTFSELQHSLDLLLLFSDLGNVMLTKTNKIKDEKKKKAGLDDIAELSKSVSSTIEVLEKELLKRQHAASRVDPTVLAPGLGFLDKFTVICRSKWQHAPYRCI